MGGEREDSLPGQGAKSRKHSYGSPLGSREPHVRRVEGLGGRAARDGGGSTSAASSRCVRGYLVAGSCWGHVQGGGVSRCSGWAAADAREVLHCRYSPEVAACRFTAVRLLVPPCPPPMLRLGRRAPRRQRRRAGGEGEGAPGGCGNGEWRKAIGRGSPGVLASLSALKAPDAAFSPAPTTPIEAGIEEAIRAREDLRDPTGQGVAGRLRWPARCPSPPSTRG